MKNAITIKKQGPIFYFAYDKNGKQLGFAKTPDEAMSRALESLKNPDLRTPEQIRIDNAYLAYKLHGVD